jgi:hypothetical protein
VPRCIGGIASTGVAGKRPCGSPDRGMDEGEPWRLSSDLEK